MGAFDLGKRTFLGTRQIVANLMSEMLCLVVYISVTEIGKYDLAFSSHSCIFEEIHFRVICLFSRLFFVFVFF